jgi:hypothetical protein
MAQKSKEASMAGTRQGDVAEGASRIIESVRDAEDSALEAVRKFVETVDDIFPDVNEDGPRHKIIESAFKMTEQLLGASNQLAEQIFKATSDVAEPKSKARSSE